MKTEIGDLKKNLQKLEEVLTFYFVDKAPFSLPENIKNLIVNFSPYLAILVLILGMPAVLVGLGLGALFSPLSVFLGPSYAAHYGLNYLLSMVVLGVVLGLTALAIAGLFKRQRKSWLYLFYASLVNLISNLLVGDLIGGLILTIIVWYILFQVKEYYKN